MKMRKLIATKTHKYGTRHLTAGEEFEAPVRYAVALVATRKARYADKSIVDEGAATQQPMTMPEIEPEPEPEREPEPEPKPEPEPEPVPVDPMNIDSLRLQATQLGINVDGRWGVARLQHEIAQRK